MVLVDVASSGATFALFICEVIIIVAGIIGYEYFRPSVISVVLFQAIAGILVIFLFPIIAAGMG